MTALTASDQAGLNTKRVHNSGSIGTFYGILNRFFQCFTGTNNFGTLLTYITIVDYKCPFSKLNDPRKFSCVSFFYEKNELMICHL